MRPGPRSDDAGNNRYHPTPPLHPPAWRAANRESNQARFGQSPARDRRLVGHHYQFEAIFTQTAQRIGHTQEESRLAPAGINNLLHGLTCRPYRETPRRPRLMPLPMTFLRLLNLVDNRTDQRLAVFHLHRRPARRAIYRWQRETESISGISFSVVTIKSTKRATRLICCQSRAV